MTSHPSPSREDGITTLDLATRGGIAATAADRMLCDVGVRDGHVRLDQVEGEGIRMADGFRSATTSAAAGGEPP